MINVSNSVTCMTLKDQPCMAILTPFDLNLDEYNQALRYYQFVVNLEKCRGGCNTHCT